MNLMRVNARITVALALIALAAWLRMPLARTFDWYQDNELEVACALTFSLAACLGWLLVWLSWRREDNETRCRKCHYILRGLTAPRCPECGEPI